jgi:drug/metabolite transporter (DMT)-like permease
MTAPPTHAATAPAASGLLAPRVLIPFVIITLVWGSTWLVIRDQIGPVPPSWSVTYRFLAASVAMVAVALWRGESLRFSLRQHLFAAALGVAQFMLNFNFVYRAEHYLTSGVVAVIFALLIVPNTLLSRLFLGTPFDRRFIAGASIAVLGVLLLLAHEAGAISASPREVAIGAALTLTAVLCASTANVMQASAMGRAQPVFAMLAWAMLWGMVFDAAFALATVGPPVMDWRWGYVAGVLYLGLIGSVLCFPLYFGIIRAVGAGPAAWSSVLVPIIAMALSTLAEGYRWSGLSIAGAILAIAGLIVALRRRTPG